MRAQPPIAAAVVAAVCGCKKPEPPGPAVQILGETALRSGTRVPASSPYFDGHTVTLEAARGETLGIQVVHRGGGPASLHIAGARVGAFDVLPAHVARPSTALYGGSRGAGDYPDELVAIETPTTDPAYFTITADAHGDFGGELKLGTATYPVQLRIHDVALALPIGAWAEYNPKEIGGTLNAPSDAERSCIAMFRDHGVLLAPPTAASSYAVRKSLLADAHFIPANISKDPAPAAADVRAWITATAGTGQVPFAIPIDEPKPAQRAAVHDLAKAVRDAGGGKDFLFAVTDEPRTEYANLVDLYITLVPHLADPFTRWAYNGAPPRAGSMVVDAAAPGPRTWGWIAYRYKLALWYAWDALYWHDRYNHRRAPPRPMARHDAVTFDDGEDHGNRDGVLAMPIVSTIAGSAKDSPITGCASTLRLEAIRRGLQDRALLELVAKCKPADADRIAARMIPTALGDASKSPSWPTEDAAWEAARRELLQLAECK